MTDVHEPAIRSFNMSRIKGKNTKPEILVRKFLFSKGIRYRLHDNAFHGKPDLVFPKYNTVLFVNGCFWHGHIGCRYFVVPKTRTEWWLAKIEKNKMRDKKNIEQLKKQGWNVLTVWECELKTGKMEATLAKLIVKLQNNV